MARLYVECAWDGHKVMTVTGTPVAVFRGIGSRQRALRYIAEHP
jgi:hypothetical protein